MVQELSIYINGKWETLDPPTEVVAMNFQLNTLAEMKDRNASYSQAISLPRSLRNERLLGIQLRIDVVSEVPYRSYPCELLVDGSRVSPAGAVIRITSLKKDYIGAQILGANADLIETLKSKSTETVKADGFGMIWMNSSIKPSGTLSNGVRYEWGYANLVKNLLSKDDAGAPEGYIKTPDMVYPALRFDHVVKWLLKEEGYDLKINEGNQDEPVGVHEYIPALIPKCAQWEEVYRFRATGAGEFTGTVRWTIMENPVPGFFGQALPGGFYIPRYSALWSGSIRLRITVPTTHTGKLSIEKNGVVLIKDVYVSPAAPYVGDIELSQGDYIDISLLQTGTYTRDFQAILTIETTQPKETTGIAIGAQYDLLASLGFSTRADILQEFMRLYGLTLELDPVNKKAHLYTLDWVYDRRAEAADWTDKLVPGEGELTYTVGNYARRNTFGLKADETNDISDEYTFTVDDTNLDESKTLWTSKFLAIADVKNGSEDAAPNFPIYEVDRSTSERTGWTLKYSKTSVPVVIRTTAETKQLELTQGYNSDIWQVDDVTVEKWRVYGMTAFAEYYSHLWNDILNKAKAIQVTVNLNAADIEGLDLMRPVWLEQYGHYFYISKIVNYIPGKLTKVNLIRM